MNTDFQPNAQYAYDKEQRAFIVSALRDIAAGEPVNICYSATHHNERLATQYGFIAPENRNPSPLADLKELDANARAELQSTEQYAQLCLGLREALQSVLKDGYSGNFQLVQQLAEVGTLCTTIICRASAMHATVLPVLTIMQG